MKPSLIRKTLLLLCAAACAQLAVAFDLPEDGQYRIRHIGGMYMAAEGTKCKIRKYNEELETEVFTFAKVTDNVYTITTSVGKMLGKAYGDYEVEFYTADEDGHAYFAVEEGLIPGTVVLRNQGFKYALGVDATTSGTKVYADMSGRHPMHQWVLEKVGAPAPTALKASTTAVSLQPYKSASVSVTDQDGNPVCPVWSTSDKSIAEVNTLGLIQGFDPGEAVITGTLGDLIVECKVTVEENAAYPELPDSDSRKNAYEGYELVFAEEFSNPGLPDATVWTFEDGYCRNNEDQYYHYNNAYVKEGVLVIEEREEELHNPHYSASASNALNRYDYTTYTSASLRSKHAWNGGYSWMYAIYEVRAKVPAIEGAWPAIWSTGAEFEWPYGGEIDLMEWYGDRIHANACWGTTRRWSAKWNSQTITNENLKTLLGSNWGDEFHVWKMVWNYDRMELWMDDIKINDIDLSTTVNQECETESANDGNGCNPFRDVRQMMWLNLAIGGNNGGSLANLPSPCRYLIDYVRVYQVKGSDGKAAYHVDSTISEPTYSLADGEWDDDCGAPNPDTEGKPDFGGVSVIDCDQDAPAAYYNLQGMRISHPKEGQLYIKRQGAKAKKIIY